MESTNISQIAVINLVTQVNTRLYTLNIPFGSPWTEINEVIEDFKLELAEMQSLALEQSNKSEQGEEIVPEVVETDLQGFSADL